ncbi:MAG: hypothetical protein ACM3IJ_04030 [Candidatus Levyibacteriota bacterium]
MERSRPLFKALNQEFTRLPANGIGFHGTSKFRANEILKRGIDSTRFRELSSKNNRIDANYFFYYNPQPADTTVLGIKHLLDSIDELVDYAITAFYEDTEIFGVRLEENSPVVLSLAIPNWFKQQIDEDAQKEARHFPSAVRMKDIIPGELVDNVVDLSKFLFVSEPHLASSERKEVLQVLKTSIRSGGFAGLPQLLTG